MYCILLYSSLVVHFGLQQSRSQSIPLTLPYFSCSHSKPYSHSPEFQDLWGTWRPSSLVPCPWKRQGSRGALPQLIVPCSTFSNQAQRRNYESSQCKKWVFGLHTLNPVQVLNYLHLLILFCWQVQIINYQGGGKNHITDNSHFRHLKIITRIKVLGGPLWKRSRWAAKVACPVVCLESNNSQTMQGRFAKSMVKATSYGYRECLLSSIVNTPDALSFQVIFFNYGLNPNVCLNAC